MRAADIKIRISAFILVVGMCLGAALTLLLWLGAPAWLYQALRWIGWAGVTILGGRLVLRASRYRAVVLLAVATAVSVIYLFPQVLGPGCGGLPRAFALDEDCRFKCTKWSPCPDGHCCDDGKIVCTVEDDPPPLVPPSISASLNCTQWGGNGWCVGDETLELSASDPQGQSVLISGDVAGNTFACPSGNTCPVPLPNGSGAIHYKVTSATALTASGSTIWSLDNDTPAIHGNLSGSSGTNGWFLSNVLISASADDPTSGVAALEYSFDGINWIAYTAPVEISDGRYTVYFRATDNAGNQNETAQSLQVDRITPNLNVSLNGTPGANGWYVSNVQANVSASDSGSGLAALEYALDGGAWRSYPGAVTLADGTHSLSVRALDAAGNLTQSDQQIYVDTITPQIALSVNGTQGAGGWYVSDIQVSASASDSMSGPASFEYSLNDGAWTPYTSALPYSEGQYSLKFRAVDQAGNTTVTPAQLLWVDKTPPEIAMRSAWNLGLTENYKVTDQGSGISGVRVVIQDGGERYPKVAWEDGDVGASFASDIFWDGRFADGTIAPAGDYYVTLKAYDAAGNESRQTATITVQNSLLTHLIPQASYPTKEPAQIPVTSPASNAAHFGGESHESSSAAQTDSVSTGGVLTNAAGIKGSTSFSVSSANTSQGTNTGSNNILWGAAAAAAIGAFTAEALRRKAEREAEPRRRKVHADEGGGMSYRQIGKAYQASLNAFKAGLMGQGLSDAEASAFRRQAIQNGSISSVEGAAQNAVEGKQKQIAESEAKRRKMEDQRAERKEQQIEALMPHEEPASLPQPAPPPNESNEITTNKPWWQRLQEGIQNAVWHPPSWLSVSYQPSTPFSIANYTLGHMVSYNPAARNMLQSIWYQQAQVDLETNYKLTTNPKGAVDVNFSDGTVTFKTSENSSVFIQPGALSLGWSSSIPSPTDPFLKTVNTTTVDFDVVGKNWLSLKVSHASGPETTRVANINGTEVQAADSAKLKVTMNVYRQPRIVAAAGALYLAWAGGLVEGALAAAPALAGAAQVLIDKVRGLVPALGAP